MALRFADSASSNSARGGVGDIVGNEEDDEDEDEDEDDIIPTRLTLPSRGGTSSHLLSSWRGSQNN